MKRTGELLKKAREEKGLSLIEIGLSLKINNKILKAIEEGEQSQLPAKTFLRGFVKSYATFLRLDSEEVLKVFHEEMGSTTPKPLLRGEATHAAKNEDTPGDIQNEEDPALSQEISRADKMAPLNEKKNTRLIAISIVVLALFGLIVFTKKMIDKYSKEAEVPIVEVDETIEDLAVADGVAEEPAENNIDAEVDTAETTGTLATTQAETATATAVENKSEAQSSEAAMAAAVATSTPTATPPAAPVTPVAAKPAVTSEAPAPTPATPAPAPIPTPAPTPTPVAAEPAQETPSAPVVNTQPTDPRPKNVELIVEALDTVNIEYSALNGKPQKIKLAVDQVHTFKSKSGLKITFSNGGAVNLILNGRELGIPGDLGKPINLSY